MAVMAIMHLLAGLVVPTLMELSTQAVTARAITEAGAEAAITLLVGLLVAAAVSQAVAEVASEATEERQATAEVLMREELAPEVQEDLTTVAEAAAAA